MEFKYIIDNLHLANIKLTKAAVFKITVRLCVFILVIALICSICVLADKALILNKKLQEANIAVEDLTQITIELNAQKDVLQEEKIELTDALNALQEENNKLADANEALESTIAELQNRIDDLTCPEVAKRDFKSYMPYTTLKDKTSPQWKLQLSAKTNSDGIRTFNGLPLIAIGTGWGFDIGDVVQVVCENGNIFKAVVGDWKADVHTDSTNKTTLANGCRCEFIVDLDVLDPVVRKSGTITTLDKYVGYVVYIVKIAT